MLWAFLRNLPRLLAAIFERMAARDNQKLGQHQQQQQEKKDADRMAHRSRQLDLDLRSSGADDLVDRL